MIDRNGIITRIEELLGSEGSRELAEAMLPLLEAEGYARFDATYGYTLDDVNEAEWLRLLDRLEVR